MQSEFLDLVVLVDILLEVEAAADAMPMVYLKD